MNNFELRETERVFKTELINNTELKFVLKKRKNIIEIVDKMCIECGISVKVF